MTHQTTTMKNQDRRRGFSRRGVLVGSAVGAVAAGLPIAACAATARTLIDIPDDGWSLHIDREALWAEDRIYLPSEVDLATLPIHPPTGGWAQLSPSSAVAVTLPATVEEHLWGAFGLRPYTGEEYRYAETDDVPQNGAYRGVSWWSRTIDIPAEAAGSRVMLHLRGARLRAEVFLNEQLVGYSIMSELPFDCDLTAAMRPGEANRLAIRITNPGGRYDWRDSTTMTWGDVRLFASHGFGGLDRGLTLSLHPLTSRIVDAWVLNTPDSRVVDAFMELQVEGETAPADLDVWREGAGVSLMSEKDDASLAARVSSGVLEQIAPGRVRVRFRVEASQADLWSVDTPVLYRLGFQWRTPEGAVDQRTVRFGFRWFGVEGIGEKALLRLNGRRLRLYSAISWGYWGYNGMWPSRELARREVSAARTLGLNALHFHRNVGKPEVFSAMDEMGLLRVMEPGGGRHAIGRDRAPGEVLPPADDFSRRFMLEKCQAMARAFRSHPSLAHYTIQNEINANLANPDVEAVLRAIHDLDPSRAVILNDGFVKRGASQAMLLPYQDHLLRSDVEPAGGWWVEHQGAGDQWYDRFYRSKDDYIHRETGEAYIVEFGEMQGCAVADNHVRLIADILARGAKTYDLQDHLDIVGPTNAFLDRWDFRQAFPTTEALYLSVGEKAYDAWRNYLENIRLGEAVDVAAISGWETTAIENHSGIVDNLRYFKADPARLSQSLRPVLAVAKPRRLAYRVGETAQFDVWLFNDTPEAVRGEVVVSLVDPEGNAREISRYDAPSQSADQFSYLLAERVGSPGFELEGRHILRVAFAGVISDRELWAVAQASGASPSLRVAYSGVANSLRDQLEAVPGVTLEPFKPDGRFDLIVASGLKAEEIERRQIGEQTGLEAQPTTDVTPSMTPGELPQDVLAAMERGVPLLAIVQETGLADGVGRQLADRGLFDYAGQVGDLRAPWMGNWNYVRAHPTFAGLPVDCSLGVLHQVEGQASNGLVVDGDGVEIIAAYSRDHDRRNGAASFVVRSGLRRVLVHRLPDMVAPLQQRWLANSLAWLAKEG